MRKLLSVLVLASTSFARDSFGLRFSVIYIVPLTSTIVRNDDFA